MAKVDPITTRSTGVAKRTSRSGTNAIAFLLLFLGAAILGRHPDWFDWPAATAINHVATDGRFLNGLAAGLAYPSVEGVLTLSLVWYCWFAVTEPEPRARLVSGVFAAVLAGIIAYLVQRALPPMPKPIFNPMLGLRLPDVLGDADALRGASFANSPTFPSERATMFLGLAIAIFFIHKKLGLFALGCSMAAEVSRIYLGIHYPTDIAGSCFLAGSLVCFGQSRWGSEVGLRFVRWERASSPSFYMCASVASYEMITAFQDLRELGAQIIHYL